MAVMTSYSLPCLTWWKMFVAMRPLTRQKSTLRVLLHFYFLVIAIAATSMLSTVALLVPFHCQLTYRLNLSQVRGKPLFSRACLTETRVLPLNTI